MIIGMRSGFTNVIRKVESARQFFNLQFLKDIYGSRHTKQRRSAISGWSFQVAKKSQEMKEARDRRSLEALKESNRWAPSPNIFEEN